MKHFLKSIFVLSTLTLMLSGCHGSNDSSSSDSSSTSDTSTSESVSSSSSSSTSSNSTDSSSDKHAAYYSSISDSISGSSLLNALHSLNSTKRKRTIGYGNHRNYFKYLEIDPNGTTPNGKMYGFYDNALVSSSWDAQATWNHEHTWPKSRGGDLVEADILMVRPASVSINSSRGNSAYAASGAYDPGQYIAEYRGIAARIMFYCAIAETSLSLVDSTSLSSSTMGKLSDLLRWNLTYAPSTSSTANLALRIEQNRNDVNESNSSLQGNRNPFVDHPEYACKIWGSTNSTTKSICGM